MLDFFQQKSTTIYLYLSKCIKIQWIKFEKKTLQPRLKYIALLRKFKENIVSLILISFGTKNLSLLQIFWRRNGIDALEWIKYFTKFIGNKVTSYYFQILLKIGFYTFSCKNGICVYNMYKNRRCRVYFRKMFCNMEVLLKIRLYIVKKRFFLHGKLYKILFCKYLKCIEQGF